MTVKPPSSSPPHSFYKRKSDPFGELSAPATGIQPGRVIGDFRLFRKLGEGGMGQVWEAKQLSLHRLVALKVMPSDRVLSASQLATFERETQAGGRLHHPSIVSVLAYGEADGVPYIAQELVGDGWTLKDVIQEARLAQEMPDDWYSRIAQFFAVAADALQLAHDAGVIHRDLKPANMLVAADDRPRIADFNLATVRGIEANSQSGDLARTDCYMSPEQANAKAVELDHRSDIFSLGTTLYEALTLQRPFDGDTRQQITAAIVYGEPLSPKAIRSKVPRDLAVICLKAMEKRRQDRYATISELATDLRRSMNNEPLVARPAGPLLRVGKWTRRYPAKTVASAFTVAALVAVSFLALWQHEAANELAQKNTKLESTVAERDSALAAEQAQRERANALTAEAEAGAEETQQRSYLAFLHGAQAELAAGNFSAAQRLHGQCPEASRDTEWHLLGRHFASPTRVLEGHESPVDSVVWSPDSTHLLSMAGETERLWDATTGESLQRHEAGFDDAAWSLTGLHTTETQGSGFSAWVTSGGDSRTLPEPPMSLLSMAPSPAGRRLAGAVESRTLAIRDAITGEILKVLEDHHGTLDLAAWSPDASRIAIGSWDQKEVRIWDTSTGRSLRVLDGYPGHANTIAWSPDGGRLVAGTDASALHVWNASTGQVLQLLDGHSGPVTSAAWSPDGTRIASGAEDGRLLLWNTEVLTALP
ncbi:MAG: hypothetical protein ACI9EF_003110 [Pseudohongiellaceae bacterium]|jgi:hypothetical protein